MSLLFRPRADDGDLVPRPLVCSENVSALSNTFFGTTVEYATLSMQFKSLSDPFSLSGDGDGG